MFPFQSLDRLHQLSYLLGQLVLVSQLVLKFSYLFLVTSDFLLLLLWESFDLLLEVEVDFVVQELFDHLLESLVVRRGSDGRRRGLFILVL